MKYDKDYWTVYYKDKEMQNNSPFSEFCVEFIKHGGELLDICCGDGRDSMFFAGNNLSVDAFDINNLDNAPFNFKQIDLTNKAHSFSYQKQFDDVYCRSVLHAVTEDIEDYILINSNNVLKNNGLLFIEARSDKGTMPDNGHYRRLIDYELIKKKLIYLGFEIVYCIEGVNLSKTEFENPVLFRIVAKKIGGIEIKSDINFPDFHKNKQPINKDSASHLLLSCKKVMDQHNIPFLLVFGTLLGAYRDNDFIGHDEDVDIALFEKDLPKISALINDGYFKAYGINLIRRDGDILISLQYKNDYIDLYFFKDSGAQYRCGGHYIERSQIDKPNTTINFLGANFKTVNNVEVYLAEKYGNDWRTPIRGKNATT